MSCQSEIMLNIWETKHFVKSSKTAPKTTLTACQFSTSRWRRLSVRKVGNMVFRDEMATEARESVISSLTRYISLACRQMQRRRIITGIRHKPVNWLQKMTYRPQDQPKMGTFMFCHPNPIPSSGTLIEGVEYASHGRLTKIPKPSRPAILVCFLSIADTPPTCERNCPNEKPCCWYAAVTYGRLTRYPQRTRWQRENESKPQCSGVASPTFLSLVPATVMPHYLVISVLQSPLFK